MTRPIDQIRGLVADVAQLTGNLGSQPLDELTEACERHLAVFIRESWPVIQPGTPYLNNWHIDAIAEHLADVDAGQITRLLINLPPRYGKSGVVVVAWPVWSWIKCPASRWMFISYAQSLSTSHSLDRRYIIESEWYQERWGNRYKLTTDQNVKTEFRNDAHGRMIATSIDGTVHGKGADRLIVDDLHDPQSASSDTQREAQIITFDRKLTTRLDDKRTGAIVIIGQRLDERDISAHVLKQGGYTHLNLPAEAEERTIIHFGGRTVIREVGDLLWPDREGPAEISQAKLQLGSYGYAAQYQQRPAPAGGGRFKQAWFRYFDLRDGLYTLYDSSGESIRTVHESECDRFCMMDPAGAEKNAGNRPCYTVIQCLDITPGGDMLLVDQLRAHLSSPDATDAAIKFCVKHDAPWLGVEQDGIGLGVIQTIRRKGLTVRAIKCRGSKQARSETAEIRMAAGMIYFRRGAPWLFDFESELLSFPNGEFLDQTDTLVHAAIWVQKTRGVPTAQPVTERTAEKQDQETQAEAQKKQDRETKDTFAETFDERFRRFMLDEDDSEADVPGFVRYGQ